MQSGGGVAAGYMLDQGPYGTGVGQSKHGTGSLPVNMGAAEGKGLIQQTERVAHPPSRRSSQQLRRRRLELQTFLAGNVLDALE
jgi:hypothetical protein